MAARAARKAPEVGVELAKVGLDVAKGWNNAKSDKLSDKIGSAAIHAESGIIARHGISKLAVGIAKSLPGSDTLQKLGSHLTDAKIEHGERLIGKVSDWASKKLITLGLMKATTDNITPKSSKTSPQDNK